MMNPIRLRANLEVAVVNAIAGVLQAILNGIVAVIMVRTPLESSHRPVTSFTFEIYTDSRPFCSRPL